MNGQTISHYKILEKLGEGGMGVVYKAEDLKLKRIVAIKFLPKRLSIHGEERERFTQEAQAASSLNHPNICTIHEIDAVNDETFIVMELIEGITLREWIRKQSEQSEGYRKLGVKEAIDVAAQIAEGLEKAHEKGIVHRDIKSENIMVTTDGRAKIMDFGLAKLRGSSKLTKTGSTVGTIAYMSPEQVEGLETDHRTDIFSFGVVLYEMLSGKLPFQAEHETAVMYEIINVDPKPISEIRQGVDSELDRIVMKCLEKDREIRSQSMRDVLVDLKRYRRDSAGKRIERQSAKIPKIAESIPAESKSRSTRSRSGLIVGGAVLGAIIVAGILYFQKASIPLIVPVKSDVAIVKITSRPGLEDEPSWSPDGKFLAYTSDDRGNYDILVLPLGGGQPIRIVDSPADDMQPAWSPDGSKIAFVSARDHGGHLSLLMNAGPVEPYVKGKAGDIFLIPAFGGAAVKLIDNGYDPAWSPDGKTIVFRSIRGGRWDLWTIAAEGGTPNQLTNDEDMDLQPSWSPDGKWIIYTSGPTSYFELCAIPAGGGARQMLTNDKSTVLRPGWSPDGKFILFSSTRTGIMNVWKIPFEPGSKLLSSAAQITVGEGDNVNITVAAGGRKIAYATVKSTADIWELNVKDKRLRQVSSETGDEDSPALSPDGKTLLIYSDRTGVQEIWTMDLIGNFLSQLTSSKLGDVFPAWSPDGKLFAYTQIDSARNDKLFVRSLSGISATKIAENGAESAAWSPDGRKLSYDRISGDKHRYAVWTHTFETNEEKQLVFLDAQNELATWSPDGKWVAFNTNQLNARHVWVIPSTGGTPREITFGEAEYSHPEWSPRDPDVIACLKDHRNVCLISVGTGKINQITDFKESGTGLDFPTWSPDGQKIYFSVWKKVGDLYTLENY
ncbi:MAG TPA: protein kinase [Bacteroidota bacterium]|nr:protein kinase [Bacteroidota bacterium]